MGKIVKLTSFDKGVMLTFPRGTLFDVNGQIMSNSFAEAHDRARKLEEKERKRAQRRLNASDDDDVPTRKNSTSSEKEEKDPELEAWGSYGY